ncbi:MAG: siderophore-interacting protein [Sphingomonadaceae bacterium]
MIGVQSEADIPALACPHGVEMVWLVNPEPGAQPGLLAERLRDVAWPDGALYAWAASEFSAMRAMREYLRGERGLGPDALYISSYWKAGETEDNHKVIKREDAEAAG